MIARVYYINSFGDECHRDVPGVNLEQVRIAAEQQADFEDWAEITDIEVVEE